VAQDGLDEVRRDWTRLGEQDPLWAVCVLPDKKDGGWDPAEFLATGEKEVAAGMGWLTSLGLPPHYGRALDFGCGAGRLSRALRSYADAVTGVDISEPMLRQAKVLAPDCSFVLNPSSDLSVFADGSFDLVYTALVLQHLPRLLVEGYLREFLRVLAPGGIAMVQVPTRPLWTAKGVLWRWAPHRLLRWGQTRLLKYPAPMRMTALPPADLRAIVAAAGGEVVGSEADLDTPDWRCDRYALRRTS
jgi:SAM-dependent methyltransferase